VVIDQSVNIIVRHVLLSSLIGLESHRAAATMKVYWPAQHHRRIDGGRIDRARGCACLAAFRPL